MTTDLKLLGWSCLLGLVYVMLAGALITRQRGMNWNAGNRDEAAKPITGAAGRAERAAKNFLETFVFFAAATLAVAVAHLNTPATALGATVYFWARVIYLPVYVVGIPYLRTAIWIVSMWGLLRVLAGLF